MSQTSTRIHPGPSGRSETFDYDRHLVAAAASGRWDRLYRTLLPGYLGPALDRPGRHVTDPVTGLPGRLAFLRNYRNDGMSVVEPCMYRAGFSTLMYLLGCSFREAVNMAGRVLMPCGAGEEVLSCSPGRRRIRGVVTGIGAPGGIFTVTVSSEPSGRQETVRGRFLQLAFAGRDIPAGERIELACLAVETVRTASGRTFVRPRWQVTRLPPKAEEERLARAGELRDAAIRQRTAALWENSLPFSAQDPRQQPLVRYFRARGILSDTPGLYGEIRFAPRLAHFDEGGRRSSWPAMVAAVRDAGGRLVTVHRTWLTGDGRKAPVGSPKQSARLPAGETISGCAVRVGGSSSIIGLAEGIETALSCALACGIPV